MLKEFSFAEWVRNQVARGDKVDELIARLDKVLRLHRPEYYAHLQSGLTADEMQTFAEYLGFSPPTAFEKLYMWRDGQSAKYFEPLFANFSYEPTQQARESHRILTQLLDAAEFELPNWWRREWIPFLANGAGDHYCVDMAGAFTGQPGQIIQFWHDAPQRTIVAPSLEAWLGSLVRTLEAEDWKAYEYYKETGEAFFIDWEPDIPDYPIRKMGG